MGGTAALRQQDRILELRAQGLSHLKISQQLGISKTAVWRILNIHGQTKTYERTRLEPTPEELKKKGHCSFVKLMDYLTWLGRSTSLRVLSDRSGFARRNLQRWEKNGSFPINTADKFCIRIGILPQDVWPDWFDDDDDEELAA